MYLAKVLISACIIVLINLLSKRSILLSAMLASIPIVSVLAIIWTYIDTKSTQVISELTTTIGWMVLPSLVFFITLPICLKNRMGFVSSLALAILLTSASYGILMLLLHKLGIQ